MPFAAAVIIKVTVLLLAAAVCALWLMKRSPAADRHLIWLFGLTGALFIPLASLTLPEWTPKPVIKFAASAPAQRVVLDVVASGAFRPQVWQVLLGVWALGLLTVTARFMADHIRTRKIVARSRAFAGDDVRITTDTTVPMVCGILRPVILLPPSASGWDEERMRLVLAHEAMHIQRRDLLTQTFAHLACAVYWFHPLVWWAESRLRLECEQACDDGVLVQGEKASTYAGHLVDIVRGLSAEARVTQGVIPMARISELENRLKAMFQPNRNRRGAEPQRITSIAVMAAVILLPLAAFRAPAYAASAKVTGVVRDASGGAVPKASVSVALNGTDRREFTTTNDVGEFSFSPLPEGTYRVTVKARGFASAILDGVEISAAKQQDLKVTLAIGQIQETLTVTGDRPASSLKPTPIPMDSPAPARIKIGGNVQAAKMLKRVNPKYPVDAKAEGIEGTVLLRTIISKDGDPLSLEPINKLVDNRLVQSALEAVRQWKWETTLLNGQPVEVITEIQINFTLAK